MGEKTRKVGTPGLWARALLQGMALSVGQGQALLALPHRSYDLVLSDLRLPGMEELNLFRAPRPRGGSA